MRLGYFTMPLHTLHGDPAVTLQEDREAVILADKLGFHDAFVGEHLTDPEENITNSFIFLATLIGETKAIRLGTGTSSLSHSHPALIAAHAAMFDHLAKGRFIFGISPGTLASDAEALGMSLAMEERNKLFSEAIDVILAIWARDAPYDIDFPGNRFKVSTAKTQVPAVGRGQMYKPTRSRGRKSSARWWRRIRRGRSPWASATSIRCRRISCCRTGCRRIGRTTPKARPGPARRQTRRTGASPAPSSSPTTTSWPRRTGGAMRIALTAITGISCAETCCAPSAT